MAANKGDAVSQTNTIVGLRKYLQKRSITSTGYNKHDLQSMAKNISVKYSDMEEDDHIEAQHSKTLVGHSGKFSVPPVGQIDE